MDSLTLEEGRAKLTQLADARRSKSLLGRQILKQFEQARESFQQAHDEATRMIQSRIETLDQDGKVTVEVVPGVPNGSRSGSHLIASNVRTIRPRIFALRSAEARLDKVIRAIQCSNWKDVPDNPTLYVEELWSTIPPVAEGLEVVAMPTEGE